MVFNGKGIAALGVERADFVLDFLEPAFDFPACGVVFDHLFGGEFKIGRKQRKREGAIVNEHDFDRAFQRAGHADQFGKIDLAYFAVNSMVESASSNTAARFWYRALLTNVLNHKTWEFTDKLMICPSDTNQREIFKNGSILLTNYAYNSRLGFAANAVTFDPNYPGAKLNQIRNPSWRARIMDGANNSVDIGKPTCFDYSNADKGRAVDSRHQARTDVLYLDGHVETEKRLNIYKRAYIWWLLTSEF